MYPTAVRLMEELAVRGVVKKSEKPGYLWDVLIRNDAFDNSNYQKQGDKS